MPGSGKTLAFLLPIRIAAALPTRALYNESMIHALAGCQRPWIVEFGESNGRNPPQAHKLLHHLGNGYGAGYPISIPISDIDAAINFGRLSMVRKIRAAFLGILIGFSLIQPAHAGGPKFPDYPSLKVSECPTKVETLGLAVGVQPIEDPNDQKKYFNTDLIRKGFMPVYIVLENRSTVDTFLFDKSAVKVGVGTSPNSGPNMASRSVETLQIVSGLVVSPIGIIVGAKLAKDEAAIQANLVKREVRSRTISPGTSTFGFLYIPVPKSGSRPPIHLQLPIMRSGDDDPFLIDVTF